MGLYAELSAFCFPLAAVGEAVAGVYEDIAVVFEFQPPVVAVWPVYGEVVACLQGF